jgi:hypothetical protein
MSGNFTAVPDVVANQSFPPSLWESAIMNNLNLGVYRQIQDTTLGVDTANIMFASIPQTFAHLIVVVFARDSGAGTTSPDGLQAQFNGDTAANYDWYESTVIGGNQVGQTSLRAGWVVPGGASANLFSATYLFIPNYTQATNHKPAVAIATAKMSNSIVYSTHMGGSWRSASAITQILLQSSTGNLKAASRATLYGLPA